MNLFWRLMRCLLMIFFLSPILNLRTLADVNVWEPLFKPTTYVLDLVCDPEIPNRMYGITKIQIENGPKYYLPSISEDEGCSWIGSYDGIGIDPEPDTWWACRLIGYYSDSFELYMIVTDEFVQSTTIYQSLDHGCSWTLYSQLPMEINELKISPVDRNIMIAGGMLGRNGVICRSIDAGKTWSIVFEYVQVGNCKDIEISSSDPNIMIVCEDVPEQHIVKSTDMGLTWTVMPTGNWGWNSSRDAAIDPTNPNIIIATIMGPPLWTHFMCRTTDGGQTWPVFGPPETDECGSGGAMSVHFDSHNPEIIYVLKNEGDTLWRSINGGEDWEMVLQDVGGDYSQKFYYIPKFVESPWDDQTIYINLAGVYVSHDRGHTWAPTGQLSCSEMFVHPTDSRYIFSADDDQGFFRSTDRGQTWHSAITGIPSVYRISNICADSHNPSHLWLVNEKTCHCSDGAMQAVYRSNDYGSSWTKMPLISGYDRIYQLQTSRHIPNRLFAVATQDDTYRLLVSDDGAMSWREIGIPELPLLVSVVESNLDSKTWMMLGKGTEDKKARFYKSSDEGVTWACKGEESGFSPLGCPVTSKLSTDPHHDQNLYIVCYPGFWKSDDLGETWSPWMMDRDGIDLILDPYHDPIKYLNGYRSVDDGRIWSDNQEFLKIQFDSDYSDTLYRIDTGSPPILIYRMTISTEKPKVNLAGFGYTSLSLGVLSLLQIYAYATDPDPNDRVTSIELFYNGEPIGDRFSDESAPGSGLFYKLYDITPSASGTFNLQLRAKDRFGLLSDPWPNVSVEKGNQR